MRTGHRPESESNEEHSASSRRQRSLPPEGQSWPLGHLAAPRPRDDRLHARRSRGGGAFRDGPRPDGADGHGSGWGSCEPGGSRVCEPQRQRPGVDVFRPERRRSRPWLSRQLHDARRVHSLRRGRSGRVLVCRSPQSPLQLRRVLLQRRYRPQAVHGRHHRRHWRLLGLRRRSKPVQRHLDQRRQRQLRVCRWLDVQPGGRVGRVAHRLRQPAE